MVYSCLLINAADQVCVRVVLVVPEEQAEQGHEHSSAHAMLDLFVQKHQALHEGDIWQETTGEQSISRTNQTI